ncbi:MAG: ATP synthase F1 subunit gamma [Bacteroidales bacterium]|nr:ATP synthase F1 subunit gamma [Bacteroidales bacterium]
MGNLKEIRTRISSVESTEKVTSAMKLVSAAKFRRSQQAIINLRPYSSKLSEIMSDISDAANSVEDMPLFAKREPNNVVIIVLTSNKGLCGGFNSSIVKETNKLVKEQYAKQHEAGNVQLVCIGKKGKEQLEKTFPVMLSNEHILDQPDFSDVAAVAEDLMTKFAKKEVDRVVVVYNQFVNAATQKVTVEQFLPIVPQSSTERNNLKNDYIFEPSKEELFRSLTPRILKLQFYKILIDSIASEHGARMTSMSKATDNANEMLKELRIKYNNARQSAITNELIEIVSGAEALNN